MEDYKNNIYSDIHQAITFYGQIKLKTTFDKRSSAEDIHKISKEIINNPRYSSHFFYYNDNDQLHSFYDEDNKCYFPAIRCIYNEANIFFDIFLFNGAIIDSNHPVIIQYNLETLHMNCFVTFYSLDKIIKQQPSHFAFKTESLRVIWHSTNQERNSRVIMSEYPDSSSYYDHSSPFIKINAFIKNIKRYKSRFIFVCDEFH